MSKVNQVSFEGAHIVYKNFQGAESRWMNKIINEQGKRNFSVVIEDPEKAAALAEAGWNVKFPKDMDRDVDYEPLPTLKVNINMGSKYPPTVKQINVNTGRVLTLDESDMASLDYSNVVFADVVIRGWEYEPGKISAYLVAIYANVEIVDPFAEKYM